MATIGTLTATIALNASELTKGAVVTRRELREVARITEQTRTPAEKLGMQVDKLGDLYRKGALPLDTYQRAVLKVRGHYESTTKAAAPFAASIARMVGPIALVTSAVGALGSAVSLAVSRFGEIDKLGDLGERIGLSAASMQTFKLAAELAGTSIDAITPSLIKLQRTLGDATNGNDAAIKAFNRLGLEAQALVNLPLESSLLAVAKAIDALPTPAEKASAAMAIFGKGGAAILTVIRDNAAALRDAESTLLSVGGVMSNEHAAAVDKADKAWIRLKASVLSVLDVQVASWTNSSMGAIDSMVAGIGRLSSLLDELRFGLMVLSEPFGGRSTSQLFQSWASDMVRRRTVARDTPEQSTIAEFERLAEEEDGANRRTGSGAGDAKAIERLELPLKEINNTLRSSLNVQERTNEALQGGTEPVL